MSRPTEKVPGSRTSRRGSSGRRRTVDLGDRGRHHPRQCGRLPGPRATPAGPASPPGGGRRPGPGLGRDPPRSAGTASSRRCTSRTGWAPCIPILLIVCMLGAVMLAPLLVAGRSPHTLIRPGETAGGPRGPGGHRPHQGGGRALHQPVPRPSDVPRRHGWVRPARRALRGATRNGQDVRGQGHGQGGQRPLPVRVGVGLPVDVLRADQPQNPVVLQAAPQVRPQGGRRHRLH